MCVRVYYMVAKMLICYSVCCSVLMLKCWKLPRAVAMTNIHVNASAIIIHHAVEWNIYIYICIVACYF